MQARPAGPAVTLVDTPEALAITCERIAQAPRVGLDTEFHTEKSYTPHLMVVPTGSTIDFPNLDPFFHNVFSLFEGKRFDLGLYEGGTTRFVQFDKPGISFIFCKKSSVRRWRSANSC